MTEIKADNPKREKAKALYYAFQRKSEEQKQQRDQSTDYEQWSAKHDLGQVYWEATNRTMRLLWAFKDNKRAFQSNTTIAQFNYEGRLAGKERRREKWRNSHYFDAWFMQTSLEADYGTFRCDKCEKVFYHSPASISKAAETLYSCCCGNCTNSIIYKDWGKEPYF
jgi:hypothetical protein